MDLQKTGTIISAGRRQKGLTQKQLAEELHISDRTISKWERGAGFPDVALLIPLSTALDIPVLSLLQGEYMQELSAEAAVRDAISVVYDQMRAKVMKNIGRIIAMIFLILFFLAFVFVILDYSGVFLRGIEMEIPAGVYVDGHKVDESIVAICGKRNTVTADCFVGRFAIAYAERTCREGVTARIDWDHYAPGYETIDYWAYGGPWESGVSQQLYVSEDMTAFAVKLDDGTIISTDDYYVPLLMSGYYYPLLN